jgi:hypothetical protein
VNAAELVAGHRYSYRGGARMGSVYAQADGTLTKGPGPRGQAANGARYDSVVVDWATRNRDALVFAHAPACCRGCGTE